MKRILPIRTAVRYRSILPRPCESQTRTSLKIGNSKPDLFLISLDRRGTETGGALALTFLYDRQDNVTFENTVFRQNQARKGGAMSAVYYSQAADDGIFTDISPIKLSNTSFSKNKAEDGGAIFFRGLVASLSNVRIANNAAQEKGGGILLEGSAMRMESSVLTSNRAKDGAGMQLGEGCSFYGFNCTFLENVAQEHGGGVSLTTWSNERQTVSYQFDNCRFKENKGNFGGQFSQSDSFKMLCRWVTRHERKEL